MKTVPVAASDGFRVWAQTYDSDPNPILALESRVLGAKIGNLRGKDFLDVACGTGRWLAEAGLRGARGFGVDFCSEMLSKAQKKTGLDGCLVLADNRHLPFKDRCADVVVCAFSLGYVEPLPIVLKELARVAKPGSSIYASDFHPAARDRGWKRTMRSGDQILEIQSQSYRVDDLMRAGQAVGLELKELLEPCLGEPERLIFRQAGQEESFEEACRLPAVLVAHWKRPLE